MEGVKLVGEGWKGVILGAHMREVDGGGGFGSVVERWSN